MLQDLRYSLLGAFITEVNDAIEALGGANAVDAFGKSVEDYWIDVTDPIVFFGLLVGAAIPPVFSAMLMLGVDRNAQRMIAEIHRQFKEIVGLKEGKPGVEREYDKCIEIATEGALKELVQQV